MVGQSFYRYRSKGEIIEKEVQVITNDGGKMSGTNAESEPTLHVRLNRFM